MTEEQYKNADNFGWNERDIRGRLLRDQITVLDFDFVQRLDSAITDAKTYYGSRKGRFKVYDFTLDEHNPEGYHPRGRAVDGCFYGLNLFEAFIIFDRWLFGGFGLYPETKPDRICHVDDRNFHRASRWVRKKGAYIYTPTVFSGALKKELKRAA